MLTELSERAIRVALKHYKTLFSIGDARHYPCGTTPPRCRDGVNAFQGTTACGSYFSEPRVRPFTMKRCPTNMRISAGTVASTEAAAISP
jgi:hypothetical protein